MTKLLTKFNDNVDNIYGRFSAREDSPDDAQPYVEIKPDKNGNIGMQHEDQTAPFISTARDVQRMGRFLKSPKGALFLTKQVVLQTGNTFAQTRLLNPLFVVEHTIPFVHAKRHLVLKRDGFLGLFGKETNNGLLQEETWKSVEPLINPRLTQKGGLLWKHEISNNRFGLDFPLTKRGILNRIKSFATSFARSLLNSIISPVRGALGYADLNSSWEGSRPELRFENGKTYLEHLRQKFESSQHYSYILPYDNAEYRDSFPTLKDTESPVPTVIDSTEFIGNFRTIPIGTSDLSSFRNAVNNFKKRDPIQTTYRPGARVSLGLPDTNKSILPHLKGEDSRLDTSALGAFYQQSYPTDDKGRKRYFKDLTQLDSRNILQSAIPQEYNSDIIDVYFRVKDRKDYTDSVRFRAFLSELAESTTPEYSETKYIGRVERFYTYQGVVRDVSFTLNLQAFSEKELDHIWRKINYLDSLAFPLNFVGGYVKPTIFEFNIGKVYINQPAILMKIDFNFDDGGVWDIEEQKPQGVTINMNLRLLEKKAYTYENSALHGPDTLIAIPPVTGPPPLTTGKAVGTPTQ